MMVTGGKAVYGAALGILMLDARFPRIPGDMGHAGTWPFPVLYRVVRGASPDRVVRHGANGLFEAFLAAGRELVRDGADAIATNCGFLSVFQEGLARHLEVPVATSSLMQVPLVAATLPPQRTVGIVTVSKESSTPPPPPRGWRAGRHSHSPGISVIQIKAATDASAGLQRQRPGHERMNAHAHTWRMRIRKPVEVHRPGTGTPSVIAEREKARGGSRPA